MEKQNKVSLWIGNLSSKVELNNIMLEVYNDEGDSSSRFKEAFNIDYIDNQFQEVFFYENFQTKQEVLDGFSYIESFINEIPEVNWSEKNSIILLYNFEYDSDVKSKLGIDFVKVLDYTSD
jgi:hypothetical protein